MNNPLVILMRNPNFQKNQVLTTPVAKNHRIIEAGSAIIYRTLLVKLKSRNKFPKTPRTKDVAFSATHLINILIMVPVYRRGCGLPMRIRDPDLQRPVLVISLPRKDPIPP